jgi:hypothetical protein
MFVEQAKRLDPRSQSIVIPSRWFAGGKGLDEFRESMLTMTASDIDDYLSASDVFKGRWASRGGSATSSGTGTTRQTAVSPTRFKDWEPSTATRPLLETGADVFIRFNEGLSILKKVAAGEAGTRVGLAPRGTSGFDGSGQLPARSAWTAPSRATRAEARTTILVYQNGGDRVHGPKLGAVPGGTPSTSGRCSSAALPLEPATRTPTRTGSSALRSRRAGDPSRRGPICTSAPSTQKAG